MNKITVDNSESYWDQNANYPNDYDLIKVEYIMGKSIMFDEWKTNIYGWVHEVIVGESRGKIEAGYPTPYDEETGSDAVSLGYFDNVRDAMKAVLESNHPDYSGYYI
jgi:hypothetical protein